MIRWLLPLVPLSHSSPLPLFVYTWTIISSFFHDPRTVFCPATHAGGSGGGASCLLARPCTLFLPSTTHTGGSGGGASSLLARPRTGLRTTTPDSSGGGARLSLTKHGSPTQARFSPGAGAAHGAWPAHNTDGTGTDAHTSYVMGHRCKSPHCLCRRPCVVSYHGLSVVACRGAVCLPYAAS